MIFPGIHTGGEKPKCSLSSCWQILYVHRSVSCTAPTLHATHTTLEANQGGTRGKEDKEDVISYMSCLASLWLSLGFLPASQALFFLSLPLGSLDGIYSAMEGRRRRAHGASFTITWKFPARSRIRCTPYPAPGLIPAFPRESSSVTEQITVDCFLSRLDCPMLTAEAAVLPASAE